MKLKAILAAMFCAGAIAVSAQSSNPDVNFISEIQANHHTTCPVQTSATTQTEELDANFEQSQDMAKRPKRKTPASVWLYREVFVEIKGGVIAGLADKEAVNELA